MKKWLVILCIALLALFLLASAAWLWLTRTESGARWAMARAAGSVERLDYEALSGGLASGVTLQGAEFAHSGTRVSAERLELAARIDLFAGPLVEVHHLRGRGIDVYLPPAEEAEPAEGPPFDLSALAIPVEVVVEEVDLQALVLHTGADPIGFERIELAGRYGERIELESLEVISEVGRATARGSWALARRGSGRLSIDARSQLSGETTQSASLQLSGRLDALDFQLTSRGPAELEGTGRLRGLPGTPSIEAELTGRIRDWPDSPADLEDLVLSFSGQPSDWRAESSARVTGAELPPGQWSLALSGGTQSLVIESLDARLLDGRITGSGQLDWSEGAPTSRASLELQSLDLTPLYPEWPNQGRISGELVASTRQGRIELESLALAAEPGELSLSGNGWIDPAGDSVDITLEWQQFAWPPVTDEREPIVSSESGRVRLEGRISDWRAEIEAMVDSPRTPAARIEARATGSGEHADVQRLDIDAGEAGSLALSGRVAWQPAPSARLQLTLESFDPAVLVSELPGRIDGRAEIRLARGDDWQFDIGLGELGGELRGQPLQGSGELTWSGDRPESADLSLQLGDNRLALSTPDSTAWQVEFDAVELAQLWPTLAGQVDFDGRIMPDAGRIELDGRVEQLRYEQYYLARADVDLEMNWLERPRVNVLVTAHDFDLDPWDRIEQLELTLEGTCAGHRLGLTAAGARGNVEFAAAGRLDGCLEPDFQWRGEIARLYLGETLAGDWRLSAPVSLALSAQALTANAACLTTAADTPARLCLEHLSAGETGRVVTRVEQVPMDLLLLPLDPVFSVTSPLSGRVEAGWDARGLSLLDGELQLGSGVLKAIGGEQDLLTVDSVRVDIQPDEGPGLMVDLRARLEGATEVNARAQLADLRRPADTRLDGEARLDLPDISAFAHFVPRFDRIGGSAIGRVEFEGPVTGPSISGRLAIHDGRVVHAPLVLDVRAIELELSGSADRASLRGRARSGEGSLNLSGQARLLDDGWHLESRIEGEAFAFAGAEWLELSASPQIAFQAGPERMRLDGDIHIDRLRGGLPPGTAERVAPSPDVQVVGEQLDDEPGTTPARRRVEGRLGIDLGDDARLATNGFRTELAGALELLWNGPPRPQARGTVTLPDGSYRTYGQTLEISGGEIIFSGQPIDNPRLDIRAVRDIFGDPEVETAGVHITGSARRPDIELYTDPPTSQETALAYVVTGSDFDHAGGQGALNVGFYLIPRLFVSYGVGLFEAGNVLSGRYELSRHWGVRLVSGERDTGVDLSYTVNK